MTAEAMKKEKLDLCCAQTITRTAGRKGGHSVRIGEYLLKEIYFT